MSFLDRVVSFLGVGGRAATPGRLEQPVAGRDFAESSNLLGLDIYRTLRAAPGNLVFSPASLSTALAMAWGGARGETAAQMKKVMHLGETPDAVMRDTGHLAAALTDPGNAVTFHVANRLFGEASVRLEAAYLEAVGSVQQAPLEPLDFKGAPEAARARINAWVKEQTRNRIRDLIASGALTSDTRLVLVNAIYFLGDWEEPFVERATRPEPFHLSKRQKKDVPTMHRRDALRYAKRRGVQALELPYRGGRLAMLLLLPDEIDGLGRFEDELTGPTLDAIVKALAPVKVVVALPKFEIEPRQTLELGSVLSGLGMTEAFDRERADFTGMANPPDPRDRLFVSEVFHKAFVKTDEKGTEAAAATAVHMGMVGSALRPRPERIVEFQADHPFLFLIRDVTSGLVVFMGRVSDPSER